MFLLPCLQEVRQSQNVYEPSRMIDNQDLVLQMEKLL